MMECQTIFSDNIHLNGPAGHNSNVSACTSRTFLIGRGEENEFREGGSGKRERE